jgi:hypothetical protein
LNARRSNDPSRGIRDTRAYAIARDESYIMQLQIPIELIIADLFLQRQGQYTKSMRELQGADCRLHAYRVPLLCSGKD